MKKNAFQTVTGVVIAFILLLNASCFEAKSQEFDIDDKVLSAGIGLGYSYGFVSGASSWPALIVSFEKGFRDITDIGIMSLGGIVGLQHASVADLNWNDIIVAARGGLHISSLNVDKLDVYGGVGLGLRFYSSPTYIWANTEWKNKTYTTVFFGLYGGGRYYFTDKIAVFGELGWDVAWFKLGISFKL